MSQHCQNRQYVIHLLKIISKSVQRDKVIAKLYSAIFEKLLDELHSQDAFGTEGQCDPRGDFRSGPWAMTRVEGLDTAVQQNRSVTTRQRVCLVLARISTAVSDNEYDADMFREQFNTLQRNKLPAVLAPDFQ